MVHEIDERLPELLQQRHPFLLAVRDGIERILHLCGEVVVHIGREILGQEPADDLADVRRGEAPAFDIDVLTIAQSGNDGRISRRPPDAVFLQRLDQGRLGESRRRLGEMLRGNNPGQPDSIALVHRRQHMIRVVLHDVVHAFLIYGDVAGLHQGRAVRAQYGSLFAVGTREHVHSDRVEDRRRHLAGHGALPDQ